MLQWLFLSLCLLFLPLQDLSFNTLVEPEVYWATTPCSGKILKIILRTNPSCLYAYTFTSRGSSKFPSHEILSHSALNSPSLDQLSYPSMTPPLFLQNLSTYKNFCHQQNLRVYCSEIFLWLLILCKICSSLSVSISLLLQHLQWQLLLS